MGNIFDLRTVDIRVPNNINGKKYKKSYRFEIKSLIIEPLFDNNLNSPTDNANELHKIVDGSLQPGDIIKLDTTFGWYDGEEWLTFPIKTETKIYALHPQKEFYEIKLVIRPIKLKFERPL